MIADKGYDADHLHEKIAGMGAEIVIPPKRNRKVQRPYNTDLSRSAMSSSASSTSLSSSAVSQHATTSCWPISWASSNSPLSQYGSNS
jgi:hypothetical protein